jgi:hypothetical protein
MQQTAPTRRSLSLNQKETIKDNINMRESFKIRKINNDTSQEKLEKLQKI